MMLGTLLSFRYLDRQVLALLSPMILADTHLSAHQFTQTISAFSYAYMVSTLIWGSVLDRIGLRMGMLISITIWAISSASHSLVSTFMGFAMARFGAGNRQKAPCSGRIPHGDGFSSRAQASPRTGPRL